MEFSSSPDTGFEPPPQEVRNRLKIIAMIIADVNLVILPSAR
jgi:hypothetical protein